MDEINLDFLKTPPKQSQSQTTERCVTPFLYNELDVNFCKKKSKSKRFQMAQNIAKVDELLQEIDKLKNQNNELQQQLKDFQTTAQQVQELYTKEKQQHNAVKNSLEKLQREYQQMDVDLTNKNMVNEQIKAQLAEYEGRPIHFNSLVVKFVKIMNKLESEDKLKYSADKDLMEKLREYCNDMKLKIPPVTSPKKYKSRQTKIKTEEAMVQCNLLTESATPSKYECPQCSNKPKMQDQHIQCSSTKRDQASQYISTMITRQTNTERIKQKHVSTMFPEPHKVPAIDDILNVYAKWSNIRSVSPLLESPTRRGHTEDIKKSFKNCGTCTMLCNIRRKIDYLPPNNSGSNIKQEIVTPSASPTPTSNTHLNMNRATRVNSLTDNNSNQMCSSILNMFNATTNSALGQLSSNAFNELWQIFGKMLLSLLQTSNAGIANNITQNTAINQQQFLDWLLELYMSSQPQNTSTAQTQTMVERESNVATSPLCFNDSTILSANVVRPQAQKSQPANTNRDESNQILRKENDRDKHQQCHQRNTSINSFSPTLYNSHALLEQYSQDSNSMDIEVQQIASNNKEKQQQQQKQNVSKLKKTEIVDKIQDLIPELKLNKKKRKALKRLLKKPKKYKKSHESEEIGEADKSNRDELATNQKETNELPPREEHGNEDLTVDYKEAELQLNEKHDNEEVTADHKEAELQLREEHENEEVTADHQETEGEETIETAVDFLKTFALETENNTKSYNEMETNNWEDNSSLWQNEKPEKEFNFIKPTTNVLLTTKTHKQKKKRIAKNRLNTKTKIINKYKLLFGDTDSECEQSEPNTLKTVIENVNTTREQSNLENAEDKTNCTNASITQSTTCREESYTDSKTNSFQTNSFNDTCHLTLRNNTEHQFSLPRIETPVFGSSCCNDETEEQHSFFIPELPTPILKSLESTYLPETLQDHKSFKGFEKDIGNEMSICRETDLKDLEKDLEISSDEEEYEDNLKVQEMELENYDKSKEKVKEKVKERRNGLASIAENYPTNKEMKNYPNKNVRNSYNLRLNLEQKQHSPNASICAKDSENHLESRTSILEEKNPANFQPNVEIRNFRSTDDKSDVQKSTDITITDNSNKNVRNSYNLRLNLEQKQHSPNASICAKDSENHLESRTSILEEKNQANFQPNMEIRNSLPTDFTSDVQKSTDNAFTAKRIKNVGNSSNCHINPEQKQHSPITSISAKDSENNLESRTSILELKNQLETNLNKTLFPNKNTHLLHEKQYPLNDKNSQQPELQSIASNNNNLERDVHLNTTNGSKETTANIDDSKNNLIPFENSTESEESSTASPTTIGSSFRNDVSCTRSKIVKPATAISNESSFPIKELSDRDKLLQQQQQPPIASKSDSNLENDLELCVTKTAQEMRRISKDKQKSKPLKNLYDKSRPSQQQELGTHLEKDFELCESTKIQENSSLNDVNSPKIISPTNGSKYHNLEKDFEEETSLTSKNSNHETETTNFSPSPDADCSTDIEKDLELSSDNESFISEMDYNDSQELTTRSEEESKNSNGSQENNDESKHCNKNTSQELSDFSKRMENTTSLAEDERNLDKTTDEENKSLIETKTKENSLCWSVISISDSSSAKEVSEKETTDIKETKVFKLSSLKLLDLNISKKSFKAEAGKEISENVSKPRNDLHNSLSALTTNPNDSIQHESPNSSQDQQDFSDNELMIDEAEAETHNSLNDSTNSSNISTLLDSTLFNEVLTESVNPIVDELLQEEDENLMKTSVITPEVKPKRGRKRKSECLAAAAEVLQPCKRSLRLQAKQKIMEESLNLSKTPIELGKYTKSNRNVNNATVKNRGKKEMKNKSLKCENECEESEENVNKFEMGFFKETLAVEELEETEKKLKETQKTFIVSRAQGNGENKEQECGNSLNGESKSKESSYFNEKDLPEVSDPPAIGSLLRNDSSYTRPNVVNPATAKSNENSFPMKEFLLQQQPEVPIAATEPHDNVNGDETTKTSTLACNSSQTSPVVTESPESCDNCNLDKTTCTYDYNDSPQSPPPAAITQPETHPHVVIIPDERLPQFMPLQNNVSLFDNLINSYRHENQKHVMETLNTKERLRQEQILTQLNKHLTLFCYSEMELDPDCTSTRLINKLLSICRDYTLIEKAIIAIAQNAERSNFPIKDLPSIIQEMPPRHLAKSLQRLFSLIRNLVAKHPNICLELMDKIESLLFNSKQMEGLSLQANLNLTQLYLMASKIQESLHIHKHPARLFIAKCLYFYQQKSSIMIHEVLMWYPTVLPYREDRTYDRSDALISVLQQILMSTKYDMENSELFGKPLLSKLRYEYHFEPFKPQLEEVVAVLVEKLKNSKFYNISLAFGLMCKRTGVLRTQTIILSQHLLPLANEYYSLALKTQEYDKRIAVLLEIISMIVKPFPLETNIKMYFKEFARFLNAFEGRPVIQEAALCSILRLQRFDMVYCYNLLCHFKPTFVLNSHTQAMLNTFLYRRPLTFWNNLKSQNPIN